MVDDILGRRHAMICEHNGKDGQACFQVAVIRDKHKPGESNAEQYNLIKRYIKKKHHLDLSISFIMDVVIWPPGDLQAVLGSDYEKIKGEFNVKRLD